MEPFAIETSSLTKRFGNLIAVESLSLQIPAGEVFAFLGPNGAGKTTTVKLLSGLLRPSSGTASIFGVDIAREPEKAKQLIGFVSDQPFAYPYLTGFEFMRLVGDLYGVQIAEQKERIPEFLEMFEIQSVAGELIATYSHGMKQKLVLASVLLHRPRVLFLDEPLVGLDPKSARMVKEIFTMLAGRGTTIFMCTHVLEIAEKLASRVGIIQKGVLIALETVAQLKDRSAKGTNLEDIFLELTGGSEYGELLRYL